MQVTWLSLACVQVTSYPLPSGSALAVGAIDGGTAVKKPKNPGSGGRNGQEFWYSFSDHQIS